MELATMMVSVGYEPASDIEAVLTDLCIQYGYCLSSERAKSIIEHPPGDAASFVDAVLKADGVAVDSLSRDAQKALTDLVEHRHFIS